MKVKFGISSYCLFKDMKSGKMDILDVVDWVADQGAEHIEIVPVGFQLEGQKGLAAEIKDRAASRGLEISNYAIAANFAVDTEEAYLQEIARVKQEVDIAASLGAKRMRHDVAAPVYRSIGEFNKSLGQVAKACQLIADYASQYEIVTSVENHGFFVQASDRVQALVLAVDRPNFRTTLDIGNFCCVDEDPVAAVRNNLPYASMIHFKDFYKRPASKNPGEGWFSTANGNYLRGSIFGHGDIEIREIIGCIQRSGYNGYASLEFEGMENCRDGTRIGFENLRRIWDEVAEELK